MSNSYNKVSALVNDLNLNEVLNSMTDSFIIIINPEAIVLFLNRKANEYKYLDYPIQVGCSLFEAILDSRKEIIKELLDGLLATGKPFRTNVTKMEDGIMVHFEISYRPILNNEEDITHVLIEARDVSVEKISGNKIKRVAGDFTRLVEHANAVIIGTDSQGYITDWNEKSNEVTGYSKSEAFARKFAELLEIKMNSKFESAFAELLYGKSMANFELSIQGKAGQVINLLMNATPRKNLADKVDGILFIGQDITELIAYRKSLEKKVAERTLKLRQSNLEIRQQNELIEKERKKSDQLLQNILPEFVASEIKEKGHVAPRHFESATILFADLVGFTELCKGLSPEDILYELNYIVVGFDMIIEKCGLEKIKTIGDGYMAVGGLPIPNSTHPSDAVHAGLEMINYINRVNENNKITNKPPWQARVGIHTGELTAGVIGKIKFAYDVWGGSVNTASRMESASEKGKVNISSATYELVKNEFNCVHRGAIWVKNMGELQMYYVNGPK
ncbi:MAG: PAS domain S-box protein [Cyclobacteriaceae bacterium]|nr:PAS domain S-box protein [Cyclobacteriaceae bacterium]